MPQCDTAIRTWPGPSSGTSTRCTSIAPSPTYTIAGIVSMDDRVAQLAEDAPVATARGRREAGIGSRPDIAQEVSP